MSSVVITTEHLGKKYVIGHQAESGRYVMLRDVVMHSLRSTWNKAKDLLHGNVVVQSNTVEEVWALRRIDLEIHQGEVIGIIGRNGCGKSTLLKILSRITEPTEGRVSIRGRVSSLLEVGTGFHPELTGRENIFLNGAILGMTRAEIRRKFDEIVDFAEIEKFLDTPVKRYSSGMFVRLAFAVAAHLEPEILLVDEVLAVGDAAFQKKCIGKMNGVAREGRTVLFVSHDMAAIDALCTRCILLAGGELHMSGTTREVTAQYLGMTLSHQTGRSSLDPEVLKRASGVATMTEVTVSTGDGVPVAGIPMGAPLGIHVRFRATQPMHPVLGVNVKTASGFTLFGNNNRVMSQTLNEIHGDGVISLVFDATPLMPGRYHLDLWLGDPIGDHDIVLDALSFEVFARDVFGTGKLPKAAGSIYMSGRWTLKTETAPVAASAAEVASV